ncbi:MAG TPA: hypothetical protein VNH42_05715 [Mariprofundaceae bacterium]|nr:hypothetical protein [Mariprofundaceae bacterium]
MIKAIGHILWQPRQIMIIDQYAGRPTRYLMVRPATIILLVALLAGGGYVGGLLQKTPADPELMPQYLQLQRDNNKLQTELADRTASIAIKDAQIAQYEKDSKTMRAKIAEQDKQIGVYNSILEAMKQAGIQLVNSVAQWRNAQTLAYSFIVVKGGNYPRHVVGFFKCYATNPADGSQVALPWNNGQENLPYQVDDHSFVDGEMAWTQPWKPTSLLLIRYDPQGREKGRYTIAIQGENQ